MTQFFDPELLEQARQVHRLAYAPYSRFCVGAALRSQKGHVFSGVNVENASYGLTRCAEQSAVQALVTSGEQGFTHIAVYSECSPPASPCGACRQVLFEFSPEAWVHAFNHLGESWTERVMDLLPRGFRLRETDETDG